MCLRAIYIFPPSICLFCCRKYVDQSWEYINRRHRIWKLGLRPRNSQKRNTSMGFSLQCMNLCVSLSVNLWARCAWTTGRKRRPCRMAGIGPQPITWPIWRKVDIMGLIELVRPHHTPYRAAPIALRGGGVRWLLVFRSVISQQWLLLGSK